MFDDIDDTEWKEVDDLFDRSDWPPREVEQPKDSWPKLAGKLALLIVLTSAALVVIMFGAEWVIS